MPKFRKKPVVVEARQLTRYNREEIAAWCGGHFEPDDIYRLAGLIPQGDLDIRTLEGTMNAKPGWWIIQGVQGEFYPCAPEIFAKTYEPESTDA